MSQEWGLITRNAGHGNGQCADVAGVAKPAPHVRRGAASGDAHQAVISAKAPLIQILASSSLQIFQPLGTAQQGGSTTGEDALNHLRITAKVGTFGVNTPSRPDVPAPR